MTVNPHQHLLVLPEALLLSRQGWTSAIWAGVAQSGGEVGSEPGSRGRG